MATAADSRRVAKAERAGRPHPAGGGTASSPVCRHRHKEAIVPVAQALVGLGFDLVATAGTAHRARRRRPRGRVRPQGDGARRRADGGRPRSPWPLRPCGQHAAGLWRSDGRLSDPRGRASRPGSCITTISGAAAAVEAIAHAQPEISVSLQERISAARRELGSPAPSRSGLTRCCGSPARPRAGNPGPVLHARGAGTAATSADEPLSHAAGRASPS